MTGRIDTSSATILSTILVYVSTPASTSWVAHVLFVAMPLL